MLCGVVLSGASDVGAETVWYRLERDSEFDVRSGGRWPLHGRLSLVSCEEPAPGTTSRRDRFWVGELELDHMPEDLESRVRQGSQVPLFGGPGVGLGSRRGSIRARAGRVTDFRWFLRHELDEERGNWGRVYRRDLVLDSSAASLLGFADDDAGCPQSLDLSLLLQHVWTQYERVGAEPAQARPVGQERETLARVRLVAERIAGSGEPDRGPPVLRLESPIRGGVTRGEVAPP
jgi:hypothetical protein